ncbi:hypothetical protein DPEC_G00340130 [Dallia pectoralis]|uniref:Uncharacterized protein n=1 Tax=Dallia pectoralis TaxID=75939 RepID=A0ACC2F539_DALPE|nr:hypothetical protein DPEC_G00340130 [Dallia pectoralis]
MTSAVTKAMFESYALMVFVMGSFFVYFCGMVWAFCNPKLSGVEEEEIVTEALVEDEDRYRVCARHPPGQMHHTSGYPDGTPRRTGDWITQTTYVNFFEDSPTDDSLLTMDHNRFAFGDQIISPSCHNSV